MKNVFITGATSGFGEAIAYKLAQHNVNMIITGRTENKLKEVAQKIESTTSHTLTFFRWNKPTIKKNTVNKPTNTDLMEISKLIHSRL